MLVKKLLEVCNKKNKAGMQLKASQIKNHLWVFINCLIVNPTFDSQTKTHMTLQMKSFGSKCTLSDKFVTAVSIGHSRVEVLFPHRQQLILIFPVHLR